MAKTNKNRVPIRRMSKFFGYEDFALEINMGREYTEGDIDFRVILYSVDIERTDTDDLYGEVESSQIQYHPPVELSVIVKLNPKENKALNPNGTMRIEEWGNLEFGVYIAHLEEMDVEIKYGDYIGYPVREDYVKYFTVTDSDEVYEDTMSKIMGGKKGFYKHIICVPADDSEFNGA